MKPSNNLEATKNCDTALQLWEMRPPHVYLTSQLCPPSIGNPVRLPQNHTDLCVTNEEPFRLSKLCLRNRKAFFSRLFSSEGFPKILCESWWWWCWVIFVSSELQLRFTWDCVLSWGFVVAVIVWTWTLFICCKDNVTVSEQHNWSNHFWQLIGQMSNTF